MLNKTVGAAIERKPKYLGMVNVVEKELLHHDILHPLHKEGYTSKRVSLMAWRKASATPNKYLSNGCIGC